MDQLCGSGLYTKGAVGNGLPNAEAEAQWDSSEVSHVASKIRLAAKVVQNRGWWQLASLVLASRVWGLQL